MGQWLAYTDKRTYEVDTYIMRRAAGPVCGKVLTTSIGREVTLDAREGAASRGSLALNLSLLTIESSGLHYLTT